MSLFNHTTEAPECPNCNHNSYVTWDLIIPNDFFDHEKEKLAHFSCRNCDYEWYDDKDSYL